MANDKQQILRSLREEFNRWEELLRGLSEEQIIAPQLPDRLSIKDVIAHLRAWQQRSVARMEAALSNTEPVYPKWPEGLDPEPQGEPHQVNAWIYETHRDQPWSTVHRAWRDGFLRFLELIEAVPEKDLLERGKYQWLEGHPLLVIPEASYEHHHVDHLEPLSAWLHEHGSTKSTG